MKTTKERTRGAVIYTRVSTGEQVKHGTSLDSQLDACRTKAQALGLMVVAEHQDAGISGGLLLTREGMQSAISDIVEGRADTLICSNISRYSRDVEHQQKIMKDVRTAGGRVVFCDTHFEDTPEGGLMFNIMGGFAEYEKKVIRERLLRGRRMRAQEGQQPSRSRPPFGYHIVTHADVTRGDYPSHEIGRYVLRDETARIAHGIFEKYAYGGYSYSTLCRELNQAGVPPPGGGRAWHCPTIRLILSNPVYKGAAVSGRIKRVVDETRLGKRHRLTGDPIRSIEMRFIAPEEQWLPLTAPALVSQQLWQDVQDRINRMSESHRGSNKQLRMLSGLTYCPLCGGRAKIRYQKANGKRYEYLRCSAFDNARCEPDPKPCSGQVYSLREVEAAVVQAITSAVQRPEAIQAAIEVYRTSQSTTECDPRYELRVLDRSIEKLRADEGAAIQAQIAGIRAGASPDAYATVFADIALRRKDLENRRGELSRQLTGQKAGNDDATGRSEPVEAIALRDVLLVLETDTLTGSEKHELIMKVIERVICRKDGAEVVFTPGLFDAHREVEQARESIVHTTCIGIRTQK